MTKEPLGCLGAILKLVGMGGSKPAPEPERLPYRQRDNFLSAAELSFFHVLSQVSGNHFHVCSKVRISDLLYVVQRRTNLAHANRIDRKHVDFVLCDPKTMQPLLVVELDDSSHQREDRQARDRLVDSAFGAAELPILHVRCRRSYDPEELKQQIRAALASSQIPSESSTAPPPLPVAVGAVGAVAPSQIPQCPKCNIEMLERTALRGRNKGKRFWACPSYPECRKIIAID